MITALPSVGVVVLAWQDEPWLAECVDAVLASTGVAVELVVVDNGANHAHIAPLVGDDRVRVLRPGRNLGFASGCNAAAAELRTDFVALVNSDAVVVPDTLRQLVDEARWPGTGPVMASIRFAERPDVLNSGGNPVHLLGLSWAGRMNTVETRTEPFDVTAASGACLLLARSVWRELGGFDEQYFAYVEDTDLSLRAWRDGWSVRCVPAAVALHHYQFSRNPQKLYLLERNRLYLLATAWPVDLLLVLAPLLMAFELAVLAQAAIGGWAPAKLRGWVWLWTHRRLVLARRRRWRAQAEATRQHWVQRLTPELEPHVIGSTLLARVVNVVVQFYWVRARVVLRSR